MDVKSISQGGLTTSGASQTISSEKNTTSNINKVTKSDSGNYQSQRHDRVITEAQVKNVVEKMSKLLDEENTHVEYEAHKGMWNVVIKIMDNKTNEIVTQIPAKQVVEAMENLYNSVGLIMDKKA
ncbi:flagellar protein FlaG [Clostridium pasteurianum]|uniref:Flagellar protein FlaG n=1 Tax=Clostridium pasteurianum BC1 TaxID=86416 RepID=R4K5E5_CLOPA|nr:flagellar protein FlaG [Clostridium pasteurianum]AGK97793.1 flagellar protein FlaG [Clostridium pasteurianum BC1]